MQMFGINGQLEKEIVMEQKQLKSNHGVEKTLQKVLFEQQRQSNGQC